MLFVFLNNYDYNKYINALYLEVIVDDKNQGGYAMSGTVVVGAQWGDEGKGKVVDYLSKDADLVVRFNGGGNAGHTVLYKGKEVKLHNIPSGVFQGKLCLLGNGVVVNPGDLLREIELLEKTDLEPSLVISKRAQVIFPHHILIDRTNGKGIGTTGKGIGPAYAGKMERTNLRMGQLVKDNSSEEIKNILIKKKKEFISRGIVTEKEFDEFCLSVSVKYASYGKKLKKYVSDTVFIINNALKNGKNVIFEGAQGVMLDIDFGTYPFVTSSNTIAQGAFTGTGANPSYIKKIIGISKAYTTRVGKGPFSTEIKGEEGNLLRNAGKEFGATTGRPRRVGYLDLFALKYAVNTSSITEIALTKIDVLHIIDELKVAVGYKIDGKAVATFPDTVEALSSAVPIYETVRPIEDISRNEWERLKYKTKKYLPNGIRNYVKLIEEFLGIPVTILSFGPERKDTIAYE